MGKNSAIESLSKLIANTIVHKLLGKKTTRPESTNYLESEEVEYRSQAEKKSRLFNWNEKDIEIIKEETLKKINNKFKNKYTDVQIPKEEIKKLIDEEIGQVIKTNK